MSGRDEMAALVTMIGSAHGLVWPSIADEMMRIAARIDALERMRNEDLERERDDAKMWLMLLIDRQGGVVNIAHREVLAFDKHDTVLIREDGDYVTYFRVANKKEVTP